jgi:penicillin amidase
VIGPPFRFISDLSNLNNSLSLLAPGQSGQPGSKHYDDHAKTWFTGEYHTMIFRRQDIEREAEATLHLTPAT